MISAGDGARHEMWNYTVSELAADRVVHVIGVALALIGTVALVICAADLVRSGELAAILLYASALLAMLGCSAVYNMWPISQTKSWLRRFDHSAIYLMIASTYTPFLTQVKAGLVSWGFLTGVWAVAVVGAVLKIALPGRFDRASIALYLLLGWSVVVAYEPIVAVLPVSTVWLIGIGGVLYSAGLIFHLWTSLSFQNAIWHAFVLTAAACHYAAVLDCMVLARA